MQFSSQQVSIAKTRSARTLARRSEQMEICRLRSGAIETEIAVHEAPLWPSVHSHGRRCAVVRIGNSG